MKLLRKNLTEVSGNDSKAGWELEGKEEPRNSTSDVWAQYCGRNYSLPDCVGLDTWKEGGDRAAKKRYLGRMSGRRPVGRASYC